MTRTVLVAAASMAGGTALGYILCRIFRRHIPRHAPKKAKIGTMDKVLILEAVVLIAYTVADLWIFYKVGAEPTTLTACVFGVCGVENGVMGWIKTNKDKADERDRATTTPAEPTETKEPPEGDFL